MNACAVFYADSHLGARFGAKGPSWPTYHHGQDVNRWQAGTPVPSFVAGEVVTNPVKQSPLIGWYVQVLSGGWYFTFCHLRVRSPLKVGQAVAVNMIVGELGNTGSQSTGDHCHIAKEPTKSIGTPRAADPLPDIIAARTSTAGGGTTPIEEDDMAGFFVLKSAASGIWLVAPGYKHHLNPDEAKQIEDIGFPIPVKDCGTVEAAFRVLMGAFTKNEDTTSGVSSNAAVLAAIASVNANIDDQPTEFVITPKR